MQIWWQEFILHSGDDCVHLAKMVKLVAQQQHIVKSLAADWSPILYLVETLWNKVVSHVYLIQVFYQSFEYIIEKYVCEMK